MAAILDAGGRRDAVAECEKLVAEEPLRERRWAQLMLALYRDERQSEALEACRRLRALLADEVGVDPGPEVRRLEAAILVQDPALQCGRRSRVRTGSRHAMACFGRERELATLLDHLADASAGRGRVTFVSGEPGIGKSRLLAELATRAAARGAQVLGGRCLEGAGAMPFHPFVEAIEAFLHGRPPPGGPRAPPTGRLAHAAAGSSSPTSCGSACSTVWRGSWSGAEPRDRSCWSSTICTGPTKAPSRCCATSPVTPRDTGCWWSAPTAGARCATDISSATHSRAAQRGGVQRGKAGRARPSGRRAPDARGPGRSGRRRAGRRRPRRDRTATPSSPVRSSTTCARSAPCIRDRTGALRSPAPLAAAVPGRGSARDRPPAPSARRDHQPPARRRLRPSRGRSCSNRSGSAAGLSDADGLAALDEALAGRPRRP